MQTSRRMFSLGAFFLLAFPLLVTSSSSVVLTKENYDGITAGKTVFIKWFAPWCGHCQALAPAWDQLAATFQSDQGLIAEVDCAVHQAWCVQRGMTGFPTLLYGDPSLDGVFLEEYDDEKSFDDLFRFAQKTLHKSICSPGNVEVCDEETKIKIFEYGNMTNSELAKSLQVEEARISKAKNLFKANKQALQVNYDEAAREHERLAASLRRQVKFYQNLVEVQQERSVQPEL